MCNPAEWVGEVANGMYVCAGVAGLRLPVADAVRILHGVGGVQDDRELGVLDPVFVVGLEESRLVAGIADTRRCDRQQIDEVSAIQDMHLDALTTPVAEDEGMGNNFASSGVLVDAASLDSIQHDRLQ